jgi:uncharacterized Fe-S center protein
MKKPKVYFASARAKEYRYAYSLPAKLEQLLKTLNPGRFISKKDKVAIKTHAGTHGAFRVVRPNFLRIIADAVREQGALPFITDTGNFRAIDNANQNGINHLSCNAPFILADGIAARDCVMVVTGGELIGEIGVAGAIYDADAMIVVSHAKGHIQSAYGGALKNIGMGCVSTYNRAGEVQRGRMHAKGEAPFEWNAEVCSFCGQCVEVCSADALSQQENRIIIDKRKCWRCGRCVRVCPTGAFSVDLSEEDFARGMMEAAAAVLSTFEKGKVFYVNFIMEFQPACDCMPMCDTPIIQDQGIMLSDDPVAIDAATLDMVAKAAPTGQSEAGDLGIREPREDLLKAVTFRDPWHVIEAARAMKLGSRTYELIEIEKKSE